MITENCLVKGIWWIDDSSADESRKCVIKKRKNFKVCSILELGRGCKKLANLSKSMN